MTLLQTIAMVLGSIAPVGLLAGIFGVAFGIALHGYVLPVMGHAKGANLPSVIAIVPRPADGPPRFGCAAP
jgi:putative ABC transport system permease protein